MRKKYLLSLLIILFLFCNAPYAQNALTGKIIMPKPTKVKVGSNYDESDTVIDPMSRPDRNVIISLHPIGVKLKTTPSEARITQKRKDFSPKVLPITVGSKVHFLNEDEFYHNVYSATPKERFNLGRRAPSVKTTEVIEKVGVIKLGCNIHDNMKAYILSFDTPYFVRVEENGTFIIENIKDGQYRIEVFHPLTKKLTEEISFNVSGKVVRNFNFNLQP